MLFKFHQFNLCHSIIAKLQVKEFIGSIAFYRFCGGLDWHVFQADWGQISLSPPSPLQHRLSEECFSTVDIQLSLYLLQRSIGILIPS